MTSRGVIVLADRDRRLLLSLVSLRMVSLDHPGVVDVDRLQRAAQLELFGRVRSEVCSFVGAERGGSGERSPCPLPAGGLLGHSTQGRGGDRAAAHDAPVAELLELSPASVLRRWRAGELPGFRLSSNVLRFAEADIDAFLAERRRGLDTRPAVATIHVAGD